MKTSYVLIFLYFFCFIKLGTLDASIYQRKSIASPEEIVVLTPSLYGANARIMKQQLDRSLMLKRFDVNQLAPAVSQSFIDAIYSKSKKQALSPDQLSGIIEEHYVAAIKAILDNTSIQQARIEQFKEKSDFSFEFSKGRSYSVTAEDLKKLYQSSFIYIPYISKRNASKKKVVVKEDGKYVDRQRVELNLEAGMLWYQLKILPDKSVDVQFVKHIKASSYQKQDKPMSIKMEAAVQSLIYKALNEIGAVFAYETKKLPMFSLYGRIESHENHLYTLALNRSSGVVIDDYFWIMEDFEDSSGEGSRKTGLLYIYQQGRKSQGVQIYGNQDHMPSWVQEAPRYGIYVTGSAAVKRGFKINSNDSKINQKRLFVSDINEWFSLGGKAAISIGNIVDAARYSHVFLDVEGAINFSALEFADGKDHLLPFSYDAYLGVRKAWWIKKLSIQPFVQIGTHSLAILDDDKKIFSMENIAYKFGISTQMMVRPFLSLNGSLFATLTPARPYVEYDYLGYSGQDRASGSSLNWFGFSFGLEWLK